MFKCPNHCEIYQTVVVSKVLSPNTYYLVNSQYLHVKHIVAVDIYIYIYTLGSPADPRRKVQNKGICDYFHLLCAAAPAQTSWPSVHSSLDSCWASSSKWPLLSKDGPVHWDMYGDRHILCLWRRSILGSWWQLERMLEFPFWSAAPPGADSI